MDHTPRSRETDLHLHGPAGRLEALLRPVPSGRTPRAVAVLCHPHPLFGGTLHNKTLYRIARRLPEECDVAALRFNFRGAGESEGRHDGGRGELEDTLAALDAAAERHPGIPLVALGYSFGAAIGLRAGAADERVRRLIALGTPLNGEWDLDFLGRTAKPRLFVHGEHDEFGSGARLRNFAARLDGEVEVRIVDGADHLFTGVEDAAVDAVVEYIGRHC